MLANQRMRLEHRYYRLDYVTAEEVGSVVRSRGYSARWPGVLDPWNVNYFGVIRAIAML